MSPVMLLDTLSTIGQWMTDKLLPVSVEVTVFALVVWLILRFVRLHAANVRKVLWLTVLFKLVFSLFVASPLSWLPYRFPIADFRLRNEKQSEIRTSPQASEPTLGEIVAQPQPVNTSTTPIIEQPTTGAILPDPVEPVQRWVDWRQVLGGIWLLGIAILLCRLALELRVLRRLMASAYPAPESLQHILKLCKAEMKVRSTVNLRLANNLSAPMLCGLWSPAIILPNWCVTQFSHAELRLMLMHELAHWKYRDTWVLLAKRLMETVFFFHPVVWYSGVQIVKEMELACDELVVTLSQASTAYANCLMQILRRATPSISSSLAAGGTANGHRIRKLLEEGQKMISTKLKPRTIAVLVLIVALGLPAWFVSHSAPTQAASEDEGHNGTVRAGSGNATVTFTFSARGTMKDGGIIIEYPRKDSVPAQAASSTESGRSSQPGSDSAPAPTPSTVGVEGGVSAKQFTFTFTPTANNASADKSLGEGELGAIIRGKGRDIEGEVHLSDVRYSGGYFWSRGFPGYLEKWLQSRTKVRLSLVPPLAMSKSVYLAWPPEDFSEENVQRLSESVDAEGLFKQPMLLMGSLDSNTKVNLTEAEISSLRTYLLEKSGFLFIDDEMGETSAFQQSIREILHTALPDYPIEPIPNDHEIYRLYYEMGGPPVGAPTWLGRPAQDRKDHLEGIFIDGRLAVLISDRGYWDALIGKGEYSPGVLRFCTNMVMYAITHGGISDYSGYTP